ncbi:MAG: glycosyltransferase family 39 protein, partial [Anaerolineae bacterium]|nr:glycosyltransferase family 39 protein [Anaerolineae bacterium]
MLALILICGAALRFYDLAWDHGTLPHPDERSTVAFYAPSLRWPEDLEQALDPRRSPLNPFWDVDAGHRRSYTYGHFPLYTLALTAAAVQSLAPTARALELPVEVVAFMETARSPVGFALIGRFLMALADTASVYLLFLLGRRIYGLWAGLLAAALSAFTVLQIQLAHFFAVDPISATFVFLALYASILLAERHSIGAALLTGLAIGLAVACKFSALPIVAAPAVALALHRTEANNRLSPHAAQSKWGLFILAISTALVTFAITSPFVLLDFPSFWQAVVQEQGDMVTGVADLPFTRQYRGTLPYLYFLEQQVLWGMGLPLGVLALLGTFWVLWRVARREAITGEYVILAWLILYFGPTGLFLAKFMRYMAPVTPLLVLFGAGMVAHSRIPSPLESEGETTEDRNRRFIALRAIAGGLALLGAMIWALAFVNGVYGAEHPWVTASRWVYQHIPDGACIAVEHWEEGFPQSLPEPGMNPAAHDYHQPLLPMYEEDTPEKFQIIKETLKRCDYLVLASNRLWRTIPRLPQRYPMSVRYYEALFSGELGFEPIYTWSTSPRLGPLGVDDPPAPGSFTGYDHTRPKNIRTTPPEPDG